MLFSARATRLTQVVSFGHTHLAAEVRLVSARPIFAETFAKA